MIVVFYIFSFYSSQILNTGQKTRKAHMSSLVPLGFHRKVRGLQLQIVCSLRHQL